MINEDLITFIQSQIRKNHSRDEITSRLVKAGWHTEDIAEGFQKINPPKIVQRSIPVSNTKPSLPEVKEPIKNTDIYREQLEVTTVNGPILPIRPKDPISSISQGDGEDIIKSGTVSYPVPEPAIIKPKPIITPQVAQPSSFSTQSSLEVKPVFIRKEESIPTLIPKAPPTSSKPSVDSVVRNIPEGALLTTLSRDIIASNDLIRENNPPKKNKKLVAILVTVIALSIIGGTVFAMMSGYITIPSFSFIKKDPKIALLSTPLTLNALQSYKSDTLISISLPSFANITNGLISGDPVTSKNKDSISLNIAGVIKQKAESPSSSLSDYSLNIKSSLLKNDINSNLKYDGKTSFINIPDLSAILEETAPPARVVSIKNDQIGLLLSLIPNDLADKVRSADIYNILSGKIPSSINSSTADALKDFINSADVAEKAPEIIRNVDTYHYQITIDRQSTKNFLTSILDPFITTLSDSEKKNLNEAIGATTLNSFEVWIGKDDSLIHQYEFSMAIPLSKVISLEDKGIAGNIVTLDWQSTFYDFNIPNTISMPNDALPIEDFIKLIIDQKIKITLSSFKSEALRLRNAEGSYGKRANLKGSCTDPIPSSLFSPVGHTKGSATAVGTIAGTMNNILSTTNGVGSCFSTLNAWAIAVPLASNPASLYCVDGLGSSVILTAPLNSTVCK